MAATASATHLAQSSRAAAGMSCPLFTVVAGTRIATLSSGAAVVFCYETKTAPNVLGAIAIRMSDCVVCPCDSGSRGCNKYATRVSLGTFWTRHLPSITYPWRPDVLRGLGCDPYEHLPQRACIAAGLEGWHAVGRDLPCFAVFRKIASRKFLWGHRMGDLRDLKEEGHGAVLSAIQSAPAPSQTRRPTDRGLPNLV